MKMIGVRRPCAWTRLCSTDAVNAWHLHVGNQTRGFVDVLRSQILLRRGKGVGFEPERPHKATRRRTNGLIIIDD
jgi:hypothetical protein